MLSESLLNEVIKQICKSLASHDIKSRNKGFKRLRKVISLCNTGVYKLEMEHFILLFKGLHYWLWSQDKLLNQESLVGDICGLLPVIKTQTAKLLFITACFETEVREWKTLDKWRTDKFLLLMRRFFRQCLEEISASNWELVDPFMDILQRFVISTERADSAFGLRTHFVSIYLEELSRFELTSDLWMKFLRPYFYLVPCMPRDHPLLKRVEDIFYLILPPTEDDGEEPLNIDFRKLAHFLYELGGVGGKNTRKVYEWATISASVKTPMTPTGVVLLDDARKYPTERKKERKRVSFGKIYRKPFKKKDAVKTPSPGAVTSISSGKGILKKNMLRQSKKLGLLLR